MKIATRFPIAVHTLLCICIFSNEERVTSEFIAGSVNVSPVIIRQILQKLKKGGLVRVERGVGGAHLERAPEEITLLDVFLAIEAVDDELFAFHPSPNMDCPIGSRIEPVLGAKLAEAQRAMENDLAKTTIADLAREVMDS